MEEEILNVIVKSLVEKEDAVKVTKEEDENSINFIVKVDGEDLGKVIGKGGKTASSVRTIMKSVLSKSRKKIYIKFEE